MGKHTQEFIRSSSVCSDWNNGMAVHPLIFTSPVPSGGNKGLLHPSVASTALCYLRPQIPSFSLEAALEHSPKLVAIEF